MIPFAAIIFYKYIPPIFRKARTSSIRDLSSCLSETTIEVHISHMAALDIYTVFSRASSRFFARNSSLTAHESDLKASSIGHGSIVVWSARASVGSRLSVRPLNP